MQKISNDHAESSTSVVSGTGITVQPSGRYEVPPTYDSQIIPVNQMTYTKPIYVVVAKDEDKVIVASYKTTEQRSKVENLRRKLLAWGE